MRKTAAVIILFTAFSVLTGWSKDQTPMDDKSWTVLKEFYQYDTGVPLDAKIVLTQQLPNCIRYKIVFTGARNSRVPAWLAVPKSGNGPYPLVIGCHGGFGSKDNFWDVLDRHNFINPMLEAGFALFFMDSVYHGERSHENDYDDLRKILEEGMKYSFSDLIIRTTIDLRRALDFLQKRDDIDITKTGVFGHSMGGIITFLLTAVDSRIRAAVPCVGPPAYSAMTYPTWLVHYAARFRNQPVLMLYAKKDTTYTPEEAENLFRFINSETKEIIWFDSGHSLPPEWSGRAVSWFKTHLFR